MSMSMLDEQRAPVVDALLGNCEEEVLGVHVLINHVHSPLLMGQTLALTSLNKA